MEKTFELKKISVIIPMYNAKNTIERSILSIVNQSYKGPLEIIVVNDGSKDNSADVVQNLIVEYSNSNIKLINQDNCGVSVARNAGLKIASGEYIAFLDSDDAWFTEKLEIQLECFRVNDKVDFLGASFEGFGNEKNKNGQLVRISFKDLLFKNYFQPSTVLFKKEIVYKVGYFDESQKYAEEGNFFMRIAKEFNCFLLNRNLITFGDGKAGFGESGLSANLKEMEKGELRNLNFAYKQGWINSALYVFTVSFSIIKYLRRILIVKLR